MKYNMFGRGGALLILGKKTLNFVRWLVGFRLHFFHFDSQEMTK